MESVLPFKIKLARLRQQLSMDELVSHMGEQAVSKMSISKIERGLLTPSEKTLSAIAKACNVPVSFFSSSEVSISPICFRYDKDMPVKKAKMLEAELMLKIEECFTKEQMVTSATRYRNPLEGKVVRTYEDAEDAASLLRNCMSIGTQPIHSVYEMLEELGVMVVEMDVDVDVDSTALLGTSTIINNVQPVVIINTRSCTTTERKRFTALHELAHLMLDIQPVSEEEWQDESLKCPTIERLCHRFAGAMLISPSSLKRRLGEYRTELSIKELISIRNMYGISIAAAVHRAHDLAIIPTATYDYLYDEHIKKNYMEIGWGEYPIMEKADRYELLEERMILECGRVEIE